MMIRKKDVYEDRLRVYWAKYGKCTVCNALPKSPCRDFAGHGVSRAILDKAHFERKKVDA